MRTIRVLAVLLLIVLVASAVFWAARRPLTEAAIGRWFAAQGVEARYRVTALSPTTVTLDAVSLGPEADPDFTAQHIEATVGWSPLRPRITAVRLAGPQLRATLSRNGITFGSVDRLIPATTGPLALPDVDVTIVDGRLRVATPAGSLAGRIDGSGRLPNGFSGRWQVAPATLAASGCTATLAGSAVTVATVRDGVRVAATGSSPRVGCTQGIAAGVGWRIAASLPSSFDRYSAKLEAQAASVASGDYRGRMIVLRGDAAAPTLGGPVAGQATVRTGRVQGPQFAADAVAANGPFQVDLRTGAGTLAAAMTLTGASATPVTGAMLQVSRRLNGTFAGPLYAALLQRTRTAARAFDATAAVTLRSDATGFHVTTTGLDARARNGARLQQAGRIDLASQAVALDGGALLSGGGLPVLNFAGAGSVRRGRVSGSATLSAGPWAAGGSAVHALRMTMRADGGSAALDGSISVSGPLGAGLAARRLAVPFQLVRGPDASVVFGARCLAIEWSELTRDTLTFGPGAARICPESGAIARLARDRLDGGASVDPLHLAGRLGRTPVSVNTGRLRLGLAGTSSRPVLDFMPALLAIAYGDARTSAQLGGRIELAGGRGAGTVAAAGVDGAGLPVRVANASGRWRFGGGRFEFASAQALVTDRAAPARFETLRIDDASAVLAGGVVDARGTGRLASSGARLFGFTARHAVASGRGTATVDTGLLGFGPTLQPYQITEMLRGIVDNVVGPVNGSGRFTWTGTTVTGRGTLAIDHVSLATASLGPIDDIAGTLVFDDLLALKTPPGQTLTIKRINPGVAVEDGVVRFQMLGPDAAAIEGIVWPYAGGTLTLAPVTVRAGDATRTFTLTVDGLDAEQFLQKFDIKDLNVTGRFDGKLPLVFAGGKGRIAAGTLVAREGGGLVQYVGAVGGEDTGAAARLAFDALRRLRYRSLALDLDGELDGELVTQLRFAGTNEAATTLGGGPVPIRATGLPFRFNVTVRAPFRALLGTAASFSDVRPLIRPAAGVQPQ